MSNAICLLLHHIVNERQHVLTLHQFASVTLHSVAMTSENIWFTQSTVFSFSFLHIGHLSYMVYFLPLICIGLIRDHFSGIWWCPDFLHWRPNNLPRKS